MDKNEEHKECVHNDLDEIMKSMNMKGADSENEKDAEEIEETGEVWEEEEEEVDDVQEMIELLKKEDFILALKTDDQLVFGAETTKKERKKITERIKGERKEERKAAI